LKKVTVFMLVTSLLTCSCGATGNFRKPSGDRVTVTLRGPSIHDGEAIAASDSLFYLDTGKEVCAARLSDVQRVYVHGYKVGPASKWFWGSTLFLTGMGLGVLILSDTGSGLMDFVLAGLDMGMGAGAASAYSVPEPDVVLSDFSGPERLERLRLRCRYPQGLTAEQWAVVLQSRGQTDFSRLPAE
jgi:hypothetical protein